MINSGLMSEPAGDARTAAGEVRVTPARLEVATPWELPQGHKDTIAEAIAGEAWLQRLGLEGLLTGITNADMRTFRSSVERLAGMLRYAREAGRDEARAQHDRLRAELTLSFEAQLNRMRAGVGFVAIGAIGVGVAIGAALF